LVWKICSGDRGCMWKKSVATARNLNSESVLRYDGIK
jgi:hypothetical protein